MDPTEIPTRFPGIAFRLVAFAIAVMAGCTRADGERPEAAETVSDARLLKQLLDEVSTLPLTDRIGTRVRTTCASARRLARVTVVVQTSSRRHRSSTIGTLPKPWCRRAATTS